MTAVGSSFFNQSALDTLENELDNRKNDRFCRVVHFFSVNKRFPVLDQHPELGYRLLQMIAKRPHLFDDKVIDHSTYYRIKLIFHAHNIQATQCQETVTLKCKDGEVHIDPTFFCSNPFFRKALNSGFKESYNKTIPFLDFSTQALMNLKSYFYGGPCLTSPDCVLECYALAKMIDYTPLRTAIEKNLLNFLAKKSSTPDFSKAEALLKSSVYETCALELRSSIIETFLKEKQITFRKSDLNPHSFLISVNGLEFLLLNFEGIDFFKKAFCGLICPNDELSNEKFCLLAFMPRALLDQVEEIDWYNKDFPVQTFETLFKNLKTVKIKSKLPDTIIEELKASKSISFVNEDALDARPET